MRVKLLCYWRMVACAWLPPSLRQSGRADFGWGIPWPVRALAAVGPYRLIQRLGR